MKIPLDHFEEYIDETILKRGLAYFKKGAVQELERETGGKYQATVSGSEDYHIEFERDEHYYKNYICSCPYDFGPVCKHVVATLFYIQQDILDIQPTKKRVRKKSTTKPKVSPVSDILSQISESEIKDFVLKAVKTNKELETLFISTYSQYNNSETRLFYQKQIRSILKKASGRERFIYRNQVRQMTSSLIPLIDNAKSALELRKDRSCFLISSALLEELVKALQYCDDSGGYLGNLINTSSDLLTSLAKEDLSPELREEFFKYCIKSLKDEVYKGWDWHIHTLELSVQLAQTDEEAKKIIAFIRELDGFEQERGGILELELLKQFESEKQVKSFIKQNMANPFIRRYEILRFMENEKYDAAIELCEEGIKQQDRRWVDWLLYIAQKSDNKKDIIEHARELFIEKSHNPSQDYYKILKTTVEPSNWSNFIEELIKEIEQIKTWVRNDLLKAIYIDEQYWDRLMVLISKNVTLNNLKNHEKYLAKQYGKEYLDLYENAIYAYLEVNVSRSYYKEVCRCLRRMKKIGGSVQVEEIIDSLRKKHPQRRALLEELTQV